MNQQPAHSGAPSWVLPLVCLIAGLFVWFVSYGVNDYGVIAGLCLALGGGVALTVGRSRRRP